MKKISIVVPVYNVEGYILNTLDSIIKQTFQDYELILVDDGTPDNSILQAESYLRQFDHIDWKVIHQANSGLSAARNKGIENASGQWVICVDSDDFINSHMLENMLNVGEENNVNCVFCGYQYVYLEDIRKHFTGDENPYIYENNFLIKKFLNREIILLVPAMLLKREMYKDLKFDVSCPHDEDIHFLWRLLFKCNKCAYIPATYYNYLCRSSSMSHNLKPKDYLATSNAYNTMTKELLCKYPDEQRIIKKIYPKYRLGGFHVLAKSTDYLLFKKTVIRDGYRRGMNNLIFYNNLKLSAYALLFCISLRLFYRVSR